MQPLTNAMLAALPITGAAAIYPAVFRAWGHALVLLWTCVFFSTALAFFEPVPLLACYASLALSCTVEVSNQFLAFGIV
jgi:hypothetical protein